jgi:hypothetical protein
MLSGALGEVPQTVESGYFSDPPLVEVPFSFDCKPFGYGDWVGTLTDDFSTDTIGNYTFDSGSGLAVSGGHLVPSSTTVQQLYYSATELRPSDVQAALHVGTGSSVSGSAEVGLVLRRINASNHLYAELLLNGASSRLRVQKRDGGTLWLLEPGVNFTATPATDYWLVARANGNTITVELHASLTRPAVSATPIQTRTYTLTGADATTFGTGVQGDVGILTSGVPTDYYYADLTIEPHTVRSSAPAATLVVPDVPGDVPAEARLIVSDVAGQDRRYVEYGIESRYFDFARPLLVDSSLLISAGYAGATATRTGAYSPGGVVRGTLTENPVAICAYPGSHVGTYRVHARCWPSSGDIYARLSWREGGGSLQANTWQAMPQAGTFVDLDLGLITIDEAVLGGQNWTGQIEAYSTTPGDTLDVDYLILVPVEEGYGKARAPLIFELPTAFSARDEFNQAAGGLNGKTLPQGGSWVTGTPGTPTGDFAVESSSRTLVRSATNDDAILGEGRHAIAGTTVLTDVLAQMDFSLSEVESEGYAGLLLRYVDENNYVFVGRSYDLGQPGILLEVNKVIGGFVNWDPVWGEYLPRIPADAPYRLRVTIDGAGTWAVWFTTTSASFGSLVAAGTDSDLAAGGVLASGKVGIYDHYPSGTAVRTYDNFLAAVPKNEPVLFAGRQMEFRHDGALRQDATGTYDGPVPEHRGPDFYPPPAGSENRTMRVLARAARNDLEQFEDAPLGDALQMQVVYRPRYIQVRR